MYGKFSDIKVVRDKVYNYLTMTLDYSKPKNLKEKMTDYIKDIIEEFPMNLKQNINCPWTENLFKVNQN